VNQWFNRNHVTDEPDAAPDTIPFDAAPVAKPPRVRDYSRESRQGTSVGYTLRRLARPPPDSR
jgi:hypothetical protein